MSLHSYKKMLVYLESIISLLEKIKFFFKTLWMFNSPNFFQIFNDTQRKTYL